MGSPLPFQGKAKQMEMLSVKTETPSRVQAQTGDTEWWHQCSAQTGAHTSAQRSLAGPTLSAQHCLIYSFNCTEGSSSFGTDPCHPSAHCSTYTNYRRGIQHLICIFHIHQKCIKRHHVLFTFDIYTTRLKMLQFPLLLKKSSVRCHTVIKIPNGDWECILSLRYTHFKTLHNRIIFWTYHLT